MKRAWIIPMAGAAAVAVLSIPALAVSQPYLSPTTAFGPITGAGGCSTDGTLEQPARASADAQLAGFLSAAARDTHTTARFPDTDIGTLGSTPYSLPVASTDVTVAIALHNMTAADTAGATSTTAMSWGVPATGSTPDLIFGSTEQMQDCAPKPTRLVSTAEGGPLATPTGYWTVGGFGSSADQTTLDSVLFTFSEPIDNFGAWFGDLETRADDVGNGDGGELGHLKLYDSTGAVLAVEPIVPAVQTPISQAAPFGCGGSSTTDPSACGNHGTRFIGFTWDTPDVAAFQVIVGDDDHCGNVPTDCNGSNERISFIGPTYAFDNPELTFEKIVINDNWGTAVSSDFSFELVADPNGTPTVTSHAHGDTVELQIGTEYAVSEVAFGGYVNTATTCLTDEGSTSGAVDVAVAPTAFTPRFGNARFSCSFTNDDPVVELPLTVTKEVVNDDGGLAQPTDFALAVTVGGTASSIASGSTFVLRSSATVTISEAAAPGYTLVSIDCRDSTNTALGNPFVPALTMEGVSCVVRNDDDVPATTAPPESLPPPTMPTTTVAPDPDPIPTPTTSTSTTTTTTTTTTIVVTTSTSSTTTSTSTTSSTSTAPASTSPAASASPSTAAPTMTPTGVLPSTGRSTGMSLQFALAAFVAGGALVGASRRRL